MKGAIVTLFSLTTNVVGSGSATERTLAGPGVGSLTLPPNLLEPGTCLRVILRAAYSTAATGNVRLKVKLGGTTVLDTGWGLTSKSETNAALEVEALIVCRTAGPTGTVMPTAIAHWDVTKAIVGLAEFSPVLVPVTTDTTKPLALDLTVQWDAQVAGNTITTTHLIVWAEPTI